MIVLRVPEGFPISFGRYRLVERLAVGGMAEVFLAEIGGEHGFEKRVVIKRLLPHLQHEAGYTAMFIDEAKLTARLTHPKIAQTHELGRVEDQLFIAMEFVDGVDVLALLREYAHRRERLPVDLAVWVAHEVLDALDYAHRLADGDGRLLGVVHRDISPSNILLSRRGDVKLVDFGIARASEPGRHHRTKSGTLKGKYGYMSPEQVLEQEVDARSDLFSVGIVLAEMLCGRRLFAAPNELDVLLMVRDAKLHRLDQYGADIERELDGILRQALAKDVDARWASAGEFRDALGDWLFQHRLRVTPKRVADAVEGIYEAAWTRRRGATTSEVAALAEVPDASAAPAVPAIAATASPRAPTTSDSPRAIRAPTMLEVAEPGVRLGGVRRHASPAADADGIPRGLLNQTDSLPIITVEDANGALDGLELGEPLPEPPPELASRPLPPVIVPPPPVVTVPPAVVVPPVGAAPGGAPAAPRRTASIPPASQPSTSQSGVRRVVQIPPLESPAAPAAAPIVAAATPAPSPRAHARPVSEGLELDLMFGDSDALELGTPGVGPAADPVVAPPPAGVAPEPSSRYPSIAAAIEAIAKQDAEPDPAAVEFDDRRAEDELRRQRLSSELPALTEQDLERAATRPPPELQSIEDTPAESGDFADVSPLRLLYRLLHTRQTGLLVVTVGAIKKEIFVRDGMPEYVSSNVASELLGNWLVAQGVLSSGELAMALAMMPHYGGKLGDTVVGLGLLKPLEVFRYLTRQVRAKLIDVCTWTRGRYAWYAERHNPREAFPLDLNAYEVLGAGALALPDEAIRTWLERHRDEHLKATRAGKFGPDRFEVPGLRELWDALDGRQTVGRFVTRYPDLDERARVLRMLVLLEACELARRADVLGG
jgi:hypothetical protein